MELLAQYTPLFVIGVTLMAVTAVAAVGAAVFFRVSGKRLEKQLEEEYGKKRR